MNKVNLEHKASYMRKKILETIIKAGKGHIGGALSCIDIIVALYYGGYLKFNPKDSNMKERDYFILSKGHSCVALYVILADLGFFPEEKLDLIGKDGSMLGGHPDRRTPGVEADTGSLGNGLGIGAGLALSIKKSSRDNFVFVLMGDGECYEGSVWEALQFSAHHKLNNLIAIIDRNKQCVLDYTEECNAFNPLDKKIESFGWDVVSINGHAFNEIVGLLSNVKTRDSDRPLMIITDTVKGKGISFMEGNLKWHHGIPKGQELEKALIEVSNENMDKNNE